MPKKSHDELLAELSKKQEALQNRIASLEARKRKDEDRKLTRKKLLIGAYMLQDANSNPENFKKLIQGMDNFLKRHHDRQLFGLADN